MTGLRVYFLLHFQIRSTLGPQERFSTVERRILTFYGSFPVFRYTGLTVIDICHLPEVASDRGCAAGRGPCSARTASRLARGPARSVRRGLGKPSLRRIATGVRDGNYPDTISHEKVNALLRGEGLPRWSKVECVVRWLAAWHNPRLSPDEVAARFNRLWLAADDARPADGTLPATAATPGSTAAADLPAPAVAIAVDDVPSGFPGEVRLPSMVRGREGVIRELCRGLDPQNRPGRPQVLTGRSGIGKSTIAYSVARIARREGGQRKVWSVDAADEGQLSRDLTKVVRDLGVSEADWSRLGTQAGG